MSPDQISYVIDDRLYLNITDRCTLRCTFCPKIRGDNRVHDYDLSLSHLPTEEEIIAAIPDPAAWDEVVFCGFGEPTLRLKVLLAVAQHIREGGGRVRVNTDGLANRVHKRNVLPELAQCVDALSVSMNTHTAELYDRHCQPALDDSWQSMLEFLAAAPAYIKNVTATAIDGLPGVDIAACEALAHERGVQFRRRELDVVG
ncbi:MAG TPA: radical SAM protein [Gammaproteobacteria bacterium]|nr:radical SAM protein [Gammaproteobacteria bacterium]